MYEQGEIGLQSYQMLTHYDYALMSYLVYLPLKEQEKSHQFKLIREKGWKLYQNSLEKKDFIQVCTYINESKKLAVIACRGLLLQDILVFTNSHVKEELKNIAINDGNNSLQQAEFLALISKINTSLTHTKKGNYAILLTGHGTGAWVVETCAAIRNYPAITFDSPGSFDSIVQQCGEKVAQNVDIVTYLSFPNIINTCYRHAGIVFRVYPSVFNYSTSKNNRIRNILSWYEACFKNERKNYEAFTSWLKRTLTEGGMHDISEAMKSGICKQVLDWPIIIWKSLAVNSTKHTNFITKAIDLALHAKQELHTIFSELLKNYFEDIFHPAEREIIFKNREFNFQGNKISIEGNYITDFSVLIKRYKNRKLEYTNSSHMPFRGNYVDLSFKEEVVEEKPREFNGADNISIFQDVPLICSYDSQSLKLLLPTKKQNASCTIVIGKVGIGKSTLVKYLLSKWQENKSAFLFEWIFLVSVNNLNNDKYPQKDKQSYTLNEILISENFDFSPSFPLISSYQRKYLDYYFKEQIRNHKVLVILDDYDAKAVVPPQLEELLLALINMPYLLITTCNYNLQNIIRNRTIGGIKKEIELMGFSKLSIEQYITNYFKPFSTSESIENLARKRDLLLQFLGNEGEIQAVCSTPLMLELICYIWKNNLNDKSIDEISSLKIKAYLFEDMLLLLSLRYLKKNHVNDFRYDDIASTYLRCKLEIAFAEHFAFMLTRKKEILGEISPTLQYLKITMMTNMQIYTKKVLDFGCINLFHSSSPLYHNTYYFSHITFQHFFCARYLVTCLWEKMKIQYKIQFPYMHTCEGISDVDKYIQENAEDKYHQPVWKFIEGILMHYEDKATLQYFHSCKGGQLGEDHQFIKGLAQKSYIFDLKREDDCTLIISCKKNQSLARMFSDLARLNQKLSSWLESNSLQKKVSLLPDDNEPVLTIKSTTPEPIDQILDWLIYLTDKLDSQPMRTAKNQALTFFTRQSLAAATHEIINSITCKLM